MGARGVIKGFLESRWGSGTSSGVRRSGSVDLHWALFARGIRCDTGRREVEGRFVGNDK